VHALACSLGSHLGSEEGVVYDGSIFVSTVTDYFSQALLHQHLCQVGLGCRGQRHSGEGTRGQDASRSRGTLGRGSARTLVLNTDIDGPPNDQLAQRLTRLKGIGSRCFPPSTHPRDTNRGEPHAALYSVLLYNDAVTGGDLEDLA
jgi:hypothetical protein